MKRSISVLLALVFLLCCGIPASALGRSSEPPRISYDPTITSTKEQWRALIDEETDEGNILMSNRNHTLPIDTSRGAVPINLLGYCAYNPVYSGAGSGAVSVSDAIDFKTSLTRAGFSVNPAPETAGVYGTAAAKSVTDNVKDALVATPIGAALPSINQKEVPLSAFRGDASFDKMKQYSDTAVVVIGRNACEGSDLSNYKSVDGRPYLKISKNEEDLLASARAAFQKLIVVFNCGNAVDQDVVARYAPDAVVWVGIPGPYGLGSLGRILNGTVNPSGRLVDTWVYDSASNPTSVNPQGVKASNSSNAYVVDYVEGIYVGYRWYETAAQEKARIRDPKTGTVYDYSNYPSIVAYPFGSGLSYTSFEQEIKVGLPKNLSPTETYEVKVKVKNTGDRAGKEVVQLYVSAPYTAYDRAHSVEKAAATLVGTGKTGELKPGKTETVKIPVSMEKIASYDTSVRNTDGTRGAYRLDEGNYTFSIRSNSHDVLQEETAKLKEAHVFTGASKRSSDLIPARNRFDDASRGIYLSRNNQFENYDSAMASASKEVKDLTFQNDPDAYYRAEDAKITKHYVKGIDYAKPGTLKYTDLRGKAYDDPLWQELLSQITIDELTNMVRYGTWMTAKIGSVGKPETLVTDGPQGTLSMFSDKLKGTSYPGEIVLASTFNKALAERYGNYVADEAHTLNISGWYAPAMDNHRNPYSGRNYEYFSEDPVLSAEIGAAECKGCSDKGLITYIKHFAVNDSETARGNNLHTYLNEQSLREIYLRPFEDSIKEGKSGAVMGGCNYIGDVWCNASKALMTDVLRNEWGHVGLVATDMCGDGAPNIAKYWYHTTPMLRAGTDIWLEIPFNSLKNVSASTDADIYYLQQAAHDLLYTEANYYILPALRNVYGIDPVKYPFTTADSIVSRNNFALNLMP